MTDGADPGGGGPPVCLTRPLPLPPAPPAGDWLQGPYVYALYQHYGYSRSDIGKLFIAGFGSSMVFGTVVGSLGDKLCASAEAWAGASALPPPSLPPQQCPPALR